MAKYTTMDEAKTDVIARITSDINELGYSQFDTCPTGGGYGWDELMHYAMAWLQRNTPSGWHIAKVYKYECYTWTITED